MKHQTKRVRTQLLDSLPTLGRTVQVYADTRILSARATGGPRIGLWPAKGRCCAGS